MFDLGLQESCADLVAKGKLSASEAMSRHTLFLGTYVFDKLWSLFVARADPENRFEPMLTMRPMALDILVDRAQYPYLPLKWPTVKHGDPAGWDHRLWKRG